jgi:hypothetical protein
VLIINGVTGDPASDVELISSYLNLDSATPITSFLATFGYLRGDIDAPLHEGAAVALVLFPPSINGKVPFDLKRWTLEQEGHTAFSWPLPGHNVLYENYGKKPHLRVVKKFVPPIGAGIYLKPLQSSTDRTVVEEPPARKMTVVTVEADPPAKKTKGQRVGSVAGADILTSQPQSIPATVALTPAPRKPSKHRKKQETRVVVISAAPGVSALPSNSVVAMSNRNQQGRAKPTPTTLVTKRHGDEMAAKDDSVVTLLQLIKKGADNADKDRAEARANNERTDKKLEQDRAEARANNERINERFDHVMVVVREIQDTIKTQKKKRSSSVADPDNSPSDTE